MDALSIKCQKQASNPGLWDSEPPMQPPRSAVTPLEEAAELEALKCV